MFTHVRRRVGAVALAVAGFAVAGALTVPAQALPPGPPPTHFGPYGGYGLWRGTCSHTGGLYGHGQITTHWDQYRGKKSVIYLEIAAAFSHTSKPSKPVLHETYTNIQNVNHPTWGKPIGVGARHQDGPLYLEFSERTPESVISVSFYWLDAHRHVMWHSPKPLPGTCTCAGEPSVAGRRRAGNPREATWPGSTPSASG
jgi:hypothetical protein